MNKLLDYTPPPPPDDVPEIEPDVTGAEEKLVKHRADATCAQCHSKSIRLALPWRITIPSEHGG